MTKEEYRRKIEEFKDEAEKAQGFFEAASICKRFRDFCSTVDHSIVEENPILLNKYGNIMDMYIFNKVNYDNSKAF